MDEKINAAVKYAAASNNLEDNTLTAEEISKIIENIKKGKTDESFLWSIYEYLEEKKGLDQKEVNNYHKNK